MPRHQKTDDPNYENNSEKNQKPDMEWGAGQIYILYQKMTLSYRDTRLAQQENHKLDFLKNKHSLTAL